MSVPSIPQDALVEVLIRLPVKSLLKFRCVSKAWYSLISSPAFISTHTHFTSSPAKKSNLLLLCLFLRDVTRDNFSLRLDDDQSFEEYRDLGLPVDGSFVRIDGSCHGLICLSSWYRPKVGASPIETTVIWNPTLGISQALPEPSFKTPSLSPNVVGFGFDGNRNDYKVIKIPYTRGDTLNLPKQYEVLELSQNAWRIVTPRVAPPYICAFASPVFLNGSVHWVGGPNERTIIAFNFADEAFREMKLPAALNVPFTDLTIKVKERRYLCVTHYDQYSENHRAISYTYDIWVMKEYGVDGSWSKLFTIHRDATVFLRPVGFRTNGELLVSVPGGGLVSYHCSTNQMTRLGCYDDNIVKFVGDYVETLVLLKARGF